MRRTISNTTQNTYNIHLFSCLFRMRFFPSSHFLTFASLDLMRSPQFSDKPKLVMQWAEAAVCSTVLDFLTFKTNKSNIFKMQFDKIAVYHSLLWQRRWRRLVSYITRIHAFYHSTYNVHYFGLVKLEMRLIQINCDPLLILSFVRRIWAYVSYFFIIFAFYRTSLSEFSTFTKRIRTSKCLI